MQRRTRFAVAAAVGGLVLSVAGVGAAPVSAGPSALASVTVKSVASTLETTPMAATGDSADDPAVWVHPTDRSKSLIIGNSKQGALETYDMNGVRVQRITTASKFWGNVDVRDNLVVSWNDVGVRVYAVDPTTRQLTNAAEGGVIKGASGEGLCLYKAGTDLYVFVITRGGVDIASVVRQLKLTKVGSLYRGTKVRQFTIPSESEGCVVDDTNGRMYVSEEDVALWRYDVKAISSSAPTRTLVDRVVSAGGRIAQDAEGVTLAGGYVIVSAQSTADPENSYFAVYSASTNAYVKSFRVNAGSASDDCDRTDGVAAYAGSLGTRFPAGVFVCHDGNNSSPGSTVYQNFKLVRWEAVRDA